MFNWGNIYVLKNESIIENEIRTSELQKGRKNKNKLNVKFVGSYMKRVCF